MRRRDFLWGGTSATLAGLAPHRFLARESSSEIMKANARGLVRPKVDLSTDCGAPAHGARVVDFARSQSVSRLVSWGLDSKDVFRYPKYPGLLPRGWQSDVDESRRRLKSAAASTASAGMEFWSVFQVFQVPVVSALGAVASKPTPVHFDVNDEHCGRSFVPSSALSQPCAHIEEARRMGALYIDERVSTAHDKWSPHAYVLPSRQFYPGSDKMSYAKPLPTGERSAGTAARLGAHRHARSFQIPRVGRECPKARRRMVGAVFRRPLLRGRTLPAMGTNLGRRVEEGNKREST